jgi:hypothetical protein
MIWLVIAIIGAGTFIFSGFSVLTDPFCESVDFGGGRVIQITCRDDGLGAFSQASAGWLSIFGGVGLLLLIFRKPIVNTFKVRNETKGQSYNNARSESVTGERFQQVSLESQELNFLSDSQNIPLDTKKCKYCAESINFEAIKCKHCGSSLTPNSSEKIQNYLMSGRGKVVSVVSVCLLLLISGLYINESNKAKELRLLNASGEVCVTSEDGSVDFGCANYPNYDFGFCSDAPYSDLSFREDYTTIGETRKQGVINDSCQGSNQYNYKYQGTIDKLRGNYEIIVWDYETDNSTTGDFELGAYFRMEIKLKA